MNPTMSSSLITSDGLSETKDCGNEGTAPAATPMLSEEQSLAIESLMCMKQQIRSSAHVSAHPVQSMSTIYPPVPPLGPSEQVQSMSTIYPPVPPLGPSEQELNEATTARAKAALISWYQRLKELYDFKLKYGHCDVPQKYSDNRCLGIWINKQRCERVVYDDCIARKGKDICSGMPSSSDDQDVLKTSLTPKKLYELEKIGFVWAKRKGDFIWNQHYNDLHSFFMKHGHSNLPCKYKPKPTLGRWITSQRSQFKRGTLPQEYIEKLDAIGFTWDMYAKPPEQVDQEIQQADQILHHSNTDGTVPYKSSCIDLYSPKPVVADTCPKFIGAHEAQVRARLGHPPLVESRALTNASDQPLTLNNASKSASSQPLVFDEKPCREICSVQSSLGKENIISSANGRRKRRGSNVPDAIVPQPVSSVGTDMPQVINNLDLLIQIATSSGEVQYDTPSSKIIHADTRKRKKVGTHKSSTFVPLPIHKQASTTSTNARPLGGTSTTSKAKKKSGDICYEQKS